MRNHRRHVMLSGSEASVATVGWEVARAQASCAPPNHEPVAPLRRWEGRSWPAPWLSRGPPNVFVMAYSDGLVSFLRRTWHAVKKPLSPVVLSEAKDQRQRSI